MVQCVTVWTEREEVWGGVAPASGNVFNVMNVERQYVLTSRICASKSRLGEDFEFD